MIKASKKLEARVCQGEIFESVEYYDFLGSKDGVLSFAKIVFPLVVVLTQDCDLAQDNTKRCAAANDGDHDKLLVSAIIAPLYNLEHVAAGEHLTGLQRTMQRLNSEKKKYIKSNQAARYHYLEFPKEIPIPPSVIDFKHYFSLNVEYLRSNKKSKFVCKVGELYREDISHRFAHFLSRIGLPDPEPI